MSESDDAIANRSRTWDILWLIGGAVVALLIAAVIGGLSMLVPEYGLFIVLSIGLTQLLWIVPLAGVALSFRRTRYAGLGLLTGALLLLLGQSACYGIFCGGATFIGGAPVEIKQ